MEKLRILGGVSDKIYYSFPIQLLVNHFKKNQILLILWFLLFAIITENFLNMVGVPYLFLDPEYLNSVNYKGFFILGVAIGIFIMSFHITTYILDSYRFSFLGTVSKPFTKFSLNNSIIPFIFLTVYVYNIISFQFQSGFQTHSEIALEILSFLGGIVIILTILYSYFWSTNKDIFKELATSLDKRLMRNKINRVNVLRKLNGAKRNKYRVDYYLEGPLKLKKCPDYSGYDKQLLLKVFDQNHLNAVIVEFFIIGIIVLLGFFMDDSGFQIPAAASGILLLSMFVMFTGAFSYWLRGWAISSVIILLIVLNYLVKIQVLNSDYRAYGLNYNTEKAVYNLENIEKYSNAENYQKDARATLKILENWKKKFPKDSKPKMIFICTSGGGQRAAAWTLRTLQHVDSSMGGTLMQHTILMTGASGGIIGASYYRELYLRKIKGEKIDLYSKKYFKNISKDILNPMIFSLVVNDVFFRLQKFKYGGYTYLKDRGYAFEEQLNKNLGYVFNKKLTDYRNPEKKGIIPMVILSPTIVNDGRKLFISPQGISYMNVAQTLNEQRTLHQKTKGVEFLRFFKKQDAENLRFLSALRMSATFPYITPNVGLPSMPTMEIMDAGLSDNFGIRDAVSFLYVFRKWIQENTGGVIFLAIRDSEKNIEIERKVEPSIIQKLISPIGSLYSNWDYLQDITNDNMLEYANGWFQGDLSIVDFQYIPKPKYWDKLVEKKIDPNTLEAKNKAKRAVLSWHLTTREKESLSRTIYESNNKASMIRLNSLMAE